MWGARSLFDATKELAEKARKAAEELERNLNDSAGVTTPTQPTTTNGQTDTIPQSSANNDEDEEINTEEDDVLNDAWDDDDINIDDDVQLDGTDEVESAVQSPDVPVVDQPTTTSEAVNTEPSSMMEQQSEIVSNNDIEKLDVVTEEGQNTIDNEKQDGQQQQQQQPSAETKTTQDDNETHQLQENAEDEPTNIVHESPTEEIVVGDEEEVPKDDKVDASKGDDVDRVEHASAVDSPVMNEDTCVANDPLLDENEISPQLSISGTIETIDEVTTDNKFNDVEESNDIVEDNKNDTLQPLLTDMKQQGIGLITSFFGGMNTNIVTPNSSDSDDNDQVSEENMILKSNETKHNDENIHSLNEPNNHSRNNSSAPHEQLKEENNEQKTNTPFLSEIDPQNQQNDDLSTINNHSDNVETSMKEDSIKVTTNDSVVPSGDLEAVIESIMSNEGTRQLLESKYNLVVGNGNSMTEMTKKLKQVQEELNQRERQLLSKTEQMTELERNFDADKLDLIEKVQNTKEEAKRRIQKAKERVEAVELKLKNTSSQQSQTIASRDETIQQQAGMIAELRTEGEKLARKQADMESVVRSARSETRELRTTITEMEDVTNKLTQKLTTLEIDYKTVQNELNVARQSVSHADKLDSNLRTIREESEKRATTILTLESEVKELRTTNKKLQNELTATTKGAAMESEQERKRLMMEHNYVVSDLEMKLQAMERTAGMREDSLQNEIDDLRKRWQDAVQNAGTLSDDIQANTAPLLRQIDSINKQNRIRSTEWAELETNLRSDLTKYITTNETLTKECNELKIKYGRLDRTYTEYEKELKRCQSELDDTVDQLHKLQKQYDDVMNEMKELKSAKYDLERLSNEGITRVRSEMTRTIMDNEERYSIGLQSLEQQLHNERNKRIMLEQQHKFRRDHEENVSHYHQGTTTPVPLENITSQEQYNNDSERGLRLRQSEDQAEILAGALGGFDAEEEDDGDGVEDDHDDFLTTNGTTNSFVALEQLTSRLKSAKVELNTLRTRLTESERIRNELICLVEESRIAREELPILQERVTELTSENHTMQLEIRGLKDDIADVRELYRTQLNTLLEEQAAIATTSSSAATEVTEGATTTTYDDTTMMNNDNEIFTTVISSEA